MKKALFAKVGAHEGNPKWKASISRVTPIYKRTDDIRSEFARDYNRILHSNAYRRLKHKTQVFFATSNDHICTRIEHVNHVASVSYTIANYLGLNTELTNAIALGHDLGHTPFGHAGEEFIKGILQNEIGETFWHERNSLRFVDKCETLPDNEGRERNLNLTYAVRDGIVCHCGEVDENSIFPREEACDLYSVQKAGQCAPFTWEGCIVKISDKIAYIGRDIEDALLLKILSVSELKKELTKISREFADAKASEINNTILMHDFIIDLCRTSSPEKGIAFSPKYLELINTLKNFNSQYIYCHERLANYKRLANLIIECIYQTLLKAYSGKDTINELNKYREIYPSLVNNFCEWLVKYSDTENREMKGSKYRNEILYHLENRKDYIQAIIDYISGMTDNFAIKIFNEITTF
ncbi:deoxyguanosinetriphosphate triphosphohydrolase family protein [Sporomusa acidovorans]|uniref:Deoxyguanosinetriphosphate triphosphohydrolase-like protein n=1 Tax=Sporomusa acidovorans (strain ATCC 49682 / DSM 3132 / Mol) TaxID=1123286 RepID=A0ABZ3J652_SPOA4|nr:dNTP triphosphohydrolase [Sporomusa acidovorans]OZC18552.1 deoxyguanosinetriphosphate triphosphohydrolase [Sporomusa acidovorans DSM 3132]SDE38173.1 dGTPase [Sporomusa acidovorans]